MNIHSPPQTSHFLSVKLPLNSIHTSTAFSWESQIIYVHNWVPEGERGTRRQSEAVSTDRVFLWLIH